MRATPHRWKKVLPHIGLWGLYIVSEYLANVFHYPPHERWSMWRNILMAFPIVVLPTYVLVGYLVPTFLQRNKLWPFLLSTLLLAALVFFLRIKWIELVNYFDSGEYQNMPWSKGVKNTMKDYAIIALAVCIAIIDDWRRKKLANEVLRQSKAEAEIQLLKGQLHPHFLFNTLNNIYSLALQQSDKTADSILRLTDLLDYLVYWSDKEKVALGKEVELIRNYLAMEQLRYGDRLLLTVDMDEPADGVKTSPLLLLPFVENCFKHGADAEGRLWIKVKLKQYNDKVVFSIENSKGDVAPQKAGGVGLSNIRQRLQLIYPNRHELVVSDNDQYFSVRLVVMLDVL